MRVLRMAHRIRRSDQSVDRFSRWCADALARGRSCLLLLEFQGAPLLHLAFSRHLRERGLPLAPHEVFLSFVVSCVRTETRSEADSTGSRATGTCIHSARPHRTAEPKAGPAIGSVRLRSSSPLARSASVFCGLRPKPCAGPVHPPYTCIDHSAARILEVVGAPDPARLRWLNSSGFRSRKLRLAARSDA
jgi:hypothetical protein